MKTRPPKKVGTLGYFTIAGLIGSFTVVRESDFPFEMHFNILDWDGKQLARFVIVFIVVLFFCRWAEFEKFFTKKQK